MENKNINTIVEETKPVWKEVSDREAKKKKTKVMIKERQKGGEGEGGESGEIKTYKSLKFSSGSYLVTPSIRSAFNCAKPKAFFLFS